MDCRAGRSGPRWRSDVSRPLRYAIIGLGKLGASMAAAIASRGYQVVGVDVSQRAVDAVNAGRAPVQETNLGPMIAANLERLRATTSHREAVLASDISFVIVPTPSDNRGAFSLQYASWAFREIGRALPDSSDYHVVVLVSTVLPGSTRYGLIPVLEEASGKVCGPDFGVCYSPDFIALGSVIHDYLHPDFNLVGEFDSRSGDLLERSYAEIMVSHPPCKRMSLENAELAKIALNTFVTTKITYANMLAELCEHLPGGDVDAVTDAIGLDSRIGRRYLTGGLGYGGPCFPRDNVALGFIARTLGVSAEVAETTDRCNRRQVANLIERLPVPLRSGSTAAILGLAYKPHSHVVEESQGLELALQLAEHGVRVVAYDPLAGDSARATLRDKAVVMDSLDSCLADAETVWVTTPDPAFQALRRSDFGSRTTTVVDFWRILAGEFSGHATIRYVAVGRGAADDDDARRLQELWRPDTG